MHIEFDGGGYGHGDVVVGGLAGQDGVEVGAGQAVELELVDDFAVTDLVRVIVQKSVIAPPCQSRTWRT